MLDAPVVLAKSGSWEVFSMLRIEKTSRPRKKTKEKYASD